MHRRLVATAVAAVLTLAAVPARAAELPTRKAGLWELTMAFEGRATALPSMQHCTDPSTDKLMTADFNGATGASCSKRDIQNSGGTITMDSVCDFGGGTTTSHAVITGDFAQSYTVKITSQRSGGPALKSNPSGVSNMTIAAKWLGACKADQKPGDIIMGNGIKINVLDKSRAPAPMPPAR
jgi:hypothetical protein